jgi:hypothetical protein
LADLLQRESVLEVGQSAVMALAECQLSAFTRASQNVATVPTLLDVLPSPSTNGVGEVFQ